MKLGKIQKFVSLSFREKLIFLEAFFLLAFCKIVIHLFPLKRIAPYLGHVNATVRKELTPLETAQADTVKLYIAMAGGNTSWNSVCLDQAMAGMIMLNRRKVPSSLCLGVKKNETGKKLDAHAWIECGDRILIGGNNSKTFTKVASFSNKASDRSTS